jgi:hypothetical protein
MNRDELLLGLEKDDFINKCKDDIEVIINELNPESQKKFYEAFGKLLWQTQNLSFDLGQEYRSRK